MGLRIKWLLAGVGLLVVLGCQPLKPSGSAWLAAEQQAHPLVGRFWSVQGREFVDFPTWLAALPGDQWLLIGEQHDHPDHQRLPREWLLQLAATDRLGPLALEMARQPQQAALDAALREPGITPEVLDWQPGWPWASYGALVQAGLLEASRVLATDLSREAQRQAYQQGAPLAASDSLAAVLDRLIDEGHCGLLPNAQLPSMRQVQLARDQAMAAVLANEPLLGRIGLMQAGSVHARPDAGIPRWLPEGLQRTSIWLRQVEAGRQTPDAYLFEGADGLPVADYIYFTPAIAPVDYCAAFRAAGQSSSRR